MSQQPYLNRLEIRSQNKYEWFQISGFIEELARFCTKLPITPRKLILTNLAGVHSSNIHTKFEGNPCSSLRKVENVKQVQDKKKKLISII